MEQESVTEELIRVVVRVCYTAVRPTTSLGEKLEWSEGAQRAKRSKLSAKSERKTDWRRMRTRKRCEEGQRTRSMCDPAFLPQWCPLGYSRCLPSLIRMETV